MTPSASPRPVFVTGSTRGIGHAIAAAFVAAGDRVTVHGRSAESAERARAELGAHAGVAADVTDAEALEAALASAAERAGPIEVLVNNAGAAETAPLSRLDVDQMRRMMALNVEPVLTAIRAVVPAMKAAGTGRIVSVASTAGLKGYAYVGAYTAAKHAVIGLTRSLARDFGPFGVRVNAVAPGWIMTERQLELWVTPETEKDIYANQCLKRRLVPDDIARVVVFMCSDEAGAITNQHYVVDGGWT